MSYFFIKFLVTVLLKNLLPLHLLEINPRFPAWVHLAAASGMNLPRAAAELASGREPPAFHGYKTGTMFVRISLDQIASIGDFERIVTLGEIARSAAPRPAPVARPDISNRVTFVPGELS